MVLTIRTHHQGQGVTAAQNRNNLTQKLLHPLSGSTGWAVASGTIITHRIIVNLNEDGIFPRLRERHVATCLSGKTRFRNRPLSGNVPDDGHPITFRIAALQGRRHRQRRRTGNSRKTHRRLGCVVPRRRGGHRKGTLQQKLIIFNNIQVIGSGHTFQDFHTLHIDGEPAGPDAPLHLVTRQRDQGFLGNIPGRICHNDLKALCHGRNKSPQKPKGIGI